MSFDRGNNGKITPINIYNADTSQLIFPIENETLKVEELEEQKENEKMTENISKDGIKLSSICKHIWFLGMVLSALFYFGNYFLFKMRIQNKIQKMNHEIFQEMKEKLHIKTKLAVYICNVIRTPILLGFFRPKVLIPDLDYSKKELELVFKHELTHFKRRDIWYKVILVIANIVHWFNPLVYVMRKNAEKDLEYTCDDAVIRDLNLEEKKIYSKAILKTMEGE